MKLKDIARAVGGDLFGDGEFEIRGVAGIREAEPGDLTFLANGRYAEFVATTKASAILLAKDSTLSPKGMATILCRDPYVAFVAALHCFAPVETFPDGVHSAATVAATARLGAGCSVGAHAVIEEGAVLGDRVIVRPGVFIGANTTVGDDTYLHPNVTLRERLTIGRRVIVHSGTVIGSDGYGFARDGDRHVKIPQIGTVVVGDDVEVGANCAIDRGTVGATRIGRGTKIDNLVHVAHNVVVGEDTLLIAQVGISGSTEIGPRVTIAGQAGIGGHITIGANAVVGAQSGVTKSIPPNERWSGYPARPHAENLRAQAAASRMVELAERVRVLEARESRIEKGR